MAQVALAIIQTCANVMFHKEQRVKKSTCRQMNAAQMQKALAGREHIKQDDYEGLILFSSRAIMTLTYSWYPGLSSNQEAQSHQVSWRRRRERTALPSKHQVRARSSGASVASRRLLFIERIFCA